MDQDSDNVSPEIPVKLYVRVIKATNLCIKENDISELNPYVSIYHRSNENIKHRTSVIYDNPNPVWDEVLTFEGIKDILSEEIFVSLKSKKKNKSVPLAKLVKITFLSFNLSETKEVVKELHWQDQDVGTLYLQMKIEKDNSLKLPTPLNTENIELDIEILGQSFLLTFQTIEF